MAPAWKPTNAERAAVTLKMIGDVNRLMVILILAGGERQTRELSEAVGDTPSMMSHRLAKLRLRGVIASRREGHEIYHGLTESGRKLAALAERLMGDWGE
jgi:ArsR family transcriptional regulator